MTTATNLFAIAKKQYGDPDGDFFTASAAIDWLNQAQRKFCSGAWPLDRRRSQTAAANQDRFPLPSEAIILEGVWLHKGYERELDYVDNEEYRRKTSNLISSSGDPIYYTLYEREVRVWPRFNAKSATSAMVGSHDTTTTTFRLATTTNFPSAGRAIVGTQEEVEYTGKTASTLTGVRRGVGGTAASTHASDIVIGKGELELWYRREPAEIATGSESPDIPSIWHEYLIHYMLYLAYKANGQDDKADAELKLYSALEQEAGNIVKRRQIAQLPRIRDRR